jgi:transcriptional regulator with XRE-family HTH domain
MHAAHERLRRAREAKGLTLATLEQKSGVRQQVLASIERAAFGELPAGLYGRQALRAYSRAVGVDPDEVVSEVAPLLVRLEDPLDGLARVRGLRRRSASPGAALMSGQVDTVAPRVLRHDWRPLVAGILDAALFGGITLVLLQLTALAAGTGLREVAASGVAAVVLLVVLIAGTYFVLLGGVGNVTLGARALGVPPERHEGAATVHLVLRRGFHCALRESSILVDVILWSAGRALNDIRRLTRASQTCDTRRA